MRLASACIVVSAATTVAAAIGGQKPMQTFFVPLPEESTYNKMFYLINPAQVQAPVVSFVSLSVSTDNTVIWWDHWEDGYEVDATKPTSNHTEIWGDGNAANGCAPSVLACSDDFDVLDAGDVVVIQNTVDLPRNPGNWTGIRYDGGDMIQTSYPIAVTRGAYPTKPGSLMAGAVEVLDVDNWGYEFVAPVGEDIGQTIQAFQYSAFHIMAAEDGTEIKLPNGDFHYLNKGVGTVVNVNMGDRVKSNKPVQVDFIIGDLYSAYELRWYSLIAVEAWSNDYTSPVGDSVGKSKVILYNPSDTSITVLITWMKTTAKKGLVEKKEYMTVPAKGYIFSIVIPTGSGARFSSLKGEPFLALSITDSEDTTSTGQATGGQWYDWGFPLVPTNMLTPQVLIGWGYGCTNNACFGQAIRSVVWLTAVADATVYVDYANTGGGYTEIQVSRLQGIKITDPNDTDMSGAVIFATERGTGPNGPPVDIAAAWGQDPAVSRLDQDISLDLGTVILPFTGVRVSKITNKETVNAGDILRYTIRIVNIGQTDVDNGEFAIVDPSNVEQVYVNGTTTYSIDGGVTVEQVPDDMAGATRFPLDEGGLPNLHKIARRGGTHEISFDVRIDSNLLASNVIVNNGYLQKKSGVKIPFEVKTPVKFDPAIRIENTVYDGQDGGESCNTDKVKELVEGVPRTLVTYCFRVTNTGKTWLKNPTIDNIALEFIHKKDNFLLAPGESYVVSYDIHQRDNTPVRILENLRNTASVSADAVFPSGEKIDPKMLPVRHSDTSEVKVIDFVPAVSISNVVFAGDGACATNGAEVATGFMNDNVTYCFNITNVGNTHLKQLIVTNEDIHPTFEDTHEDLVAPGGSFIMTSSSKIDGNYSNTATVVAVPALADGSALTDYDKPTASDESAIVGRVPPSTNVKNGDKNPFAPPNINDPDTPTECMTPHWRDEGNTRDLICRSNDITIKSLMSERATCKEDEDITITVNAKLLFKYGLYDPAWFVATDGGDAKMGTCVLKGLISGNNYSVTDPNQPGVEIGQVSWNADASGGNDKCGDVILAGGQALVSASFLVQTPMKCVDSNNDGSLDFEVCFSWRTKQRDGFCTLTNDDPDTHGALADVFPADNMKCNCVRAELPSVSVERKSSDKPVAQCY